MVIDCRSDLHFCMSDICICRSEVHICRSDVHTCRSDGYRLQVRFTLLQVGYMHLQVGCTHLQVGWSSIVGRIYIFVGQIYAFVGRMYTFVGWMVIGCRSRNKKIHNQEPKIAAQAKIFFSLKDSKRGKINDKRLKKQIFNFSRIIVYTDRFFLFCTRVLSELSMLLRSYSEIRTKNSKFRGGRMSPTPLYPPLTRIDFLFHFISDICVDS